MHTKLRPDYENKFRPLVGVAIAVHNRADRTRECLEAVMRSSYENIFICVVDDGSSDGTWKMLHNEFPRVKAINGDGNLWWSGATNIAIKSCLERGCAYVLLLNPDCIVNLNTISELTEAEQSMPGSVIASTVTDISNPVKIWWAGSTWGPSKYFPSIWLLRHKYKHGESISVLPDHPFETSDFTGRAVLVPKVIFESVGLLDENTFPQYAGDNDFGLRVTSSGHVALVCPQAISFLYVDETGQNINSNYYNFPMRYIRRMFYRKHGEVARCWWHLLRRYAPSYAFWPSFLTVFVTTLLITLKSPYKQGHDE